MSKSIGQEAAEAVIDEIRSDLSHYDTPFPEKGTHARLASIIDKIVEQRSGSVLAHRDATGVDSHQQTVFDSVRVELDRATAKWAYPNVGRAHYGYAVIREELDELWEEVKVDNYQKAKIEAIHVAATAIRFVIEVPDSPLSSPIQTATDTVRKEE